MGKISKRFGGKGQGKKGVSPPDIQHHRSAFRENRVDFQKAMDIVSEELNGPKPKPYIPPKPEPTPAYKAPQEPIRKEFHRNSLPTTDLKPGDMIRTYKGIPVEIIYLPDPPTVLLKPKPLEKRHIRSLFCGVSRELDAITFTVKEYIEPELSRPRKTTRNRINDLYRAAEWLTRTNQGRNELHALQLATQDNRESIEKHIGKPINLDQL